MAADEVTELVATMINEEASAASRRSAFEALNQKPHMGKLTTRLNDIFDPKTSGQWQRYLLYHLEVVERLGESQMKVVIPALLATMESRPLDHYRTEQFGAAEATAVQNIAISQSEEVLTQTQNEIVRIVKSKFLQAKEVGVKVEWLYVLAGSTKPGIFNPVQLEPARTFLYEQLTTSREQGIRKAAFVSLNIGGDYQSIIRALNGERVHPSLIESIHAMILNRYKNKPPREVMPTIRKIEAESKNNDLKELAASAIDSDNQQKLYEEMIKDPASCKNILDALDSLL